jgi:hypothetical protein
MPIRQKKRFARVRTPMDGSCFYHALRMGLAREGVPNPPSVPSLRKSVSERLAREADGAANGAARREAQRAAKRAKDGAWAENEEVSAAAEEVGVRIRVWEGANGMWVTFGSDASPITLCMHNPRNDHFELIVPVV